MTTITDEKELEVAVYGGSFLRGGSEDSIDEGIKLGKVALEIGGVRIADSKELFGERMVVTASTVGLQAKGKGVLKPRNYIEAIRIIESEFRRAQWTDKFRKGGLNTVATWIQAAALGLPVVDASCEDRAHPTILMGSMVLHKVEDYVSLQSFSVGFIEKTI